MNEKLRKIIFKTSIKGRILQRRIYLPKELVEFCDYKKGDTLYFVEDGDRFFLSRIHIKYAPRSSLYCVGHSKSWMVILPKNTLTNLMLNDTIYCYSVDADTIWFIKEEKKEEVVVECQE